MKRERRDPIEMRNRLHKARKVEKPNVLFNDVEQSKGGGEVSLPPSERGGKA